MLRDDRIPERFAYITRIEPGRVLATLEAWFSQYGHERPLVVLDTLGKVMPPALAGETTYGRDYRVGAALHDLCDRHPGTSLLINHHDRKAAAADFVAMVSGTNGIAGAVDTVLVLVRERHQSGGVLKVTGRDVAENEYALNFRDGFAWVLDGDDLRASASKAETIRVKEDLGDRSVEVVEIVRAHSEGVRPPDVAEVLGIDGQTAGTYLARLAKTGRIARRERGLYTPLESVESVESREVPLPQFNKSTLSTPREGGQRDRGDTPTEGESLNKRKSACGMDTYFCSRCKVELLLDAEEEERVTESTELLCIFCAPSEKDGTEHLNGDYPFGALTL